MFDQFWDKAYPKHKNLILFKLFNDIAGIPPIFPDILPFFQLLYKVTSTVFQKQSNTNDCLG